MASLTALRVAHRFIAAGSVRVVVDVPATLSARKKYPLFTSMVIARFDQAFALYRAFDGRELKHILSSGRITGGSYSVKAERDHGASWGHNISEIVPWANNQRGGRLGTDLYLAKLDGFDQVFMHLDPEFDIDPNGPPEQEAVMRGDRCNTGIGCSVLNVSADDCEFYRIRPDNQIERMTLSELRREAA